MKILTIEPFYGGSHQSFLDGLVRHSRHEFQFLTQSARHWKWRMRSSAFFLAQDWKSAPPNPDLIFASDFLDLPTFLGFIGPCNARKVLYFHENQITYPSRTSHQRDMHFGFTNILSAAVADEIWFNSEWHRADFFSGAKKLVQTLPDNAAATLNGCEEKSRVLYPGINSPRMKYDKNHGQPLTILWNHRWEFDKNPNAFVKAIESIADLNFRLIICGQNFEEVPSELLRLKGQLADKIVHWGFVSSRTEYAGLLDRADIVISTAIHEFFGISILEAIAHGAVPLVPTRLSYPELIPTTHHELCLYCDDDELHRKLRKWIQEPSIVREKSLESIADRFDWAKQGPAFDQAFELCS